VCARLTVDMADDELPSVTSCGGFLGFEALAGGIKGLATENRRAPPARAAAHGRRHTHDAMATTEPASTSANSKELKCTPTLPHALAWPRCMPLPYADRVCVGLAACWRSRAINSPSRLASTVTTSIGALHRVVVYGHTTMNTPYLVRTAKLSIVRPCQYYGGGPRGNPRCCRLSFGRFFWCCGFSFSAGRPSPQPRPSDQKRPQSRSFPNEHTCTGARISSR
jgi:hypothetical protein